MFQIRRKQKADREEGGSYFGESSQRKSLQGVTFRFRVEGVTLKKVGTGVGVSTLSRGWGKALVWEETF